MGEGRLPWNGETGPDRAALGIGDLEGGPQSEDCPFSPQNSSLGLSEAWARGGWEGAGEESPLTHSPFGESGEEKGD